MNFTYTAYEEMLQLLRQNNYRICNYENHRQHERCVILRHDVDMCLDAALRFVELEQRNDVQSTYFILLSTGFYNIFAKRAYEIIKTIKDMGHDIGLHFDEIRYQINSNEELICHVEKEVLIMSQALEMEIKTVSMHRPSKWVLDADVQFDRVINSYGKEFFNDFKYLSDSRMHWREDVYQVIESGAYDKLHILTHPFWYGDEETGMADMLMNFIRGQGEKAYDNMKENIRDLEEVISKRDI